MAKLGLDEYTLRVEKVWRDAMEGMRVDVVVDDASLAAFHAQVIFDGKEFSFGEVDRDGEILLNGKKKRRSALVHNDRLRLGQVEFVFSLLDELSDEPDEDDEDAPARDAASEVMGMRKVAELSQRLITLRTVPEQLDALLDAVIEATSAKKGFVILMRDGAPLIAAARNVDKRSIPEGVTQLSDSIVKRVLETKRPVIVSDARQDTLFRSAVSVLNLRLSSVMAAPLFARGELFGIIYLGNDDVISLFESASLDLLAIFSGQASLALENALLLDQLTLDRDTLAKSLEARRFGDLIGSCPGLVEVMKKVERVSTTDISVLITGETGTGKELVARAIHERSTRASGPFVVVNCGAIPENLMESELFGHVRGAFTGAIATRTGRFQAANGGTLFLDEIGEMPLSLQVKLLRALQERTVTKVGDQKPEKIDIRVLAATHRDLEAMIVATQFREDLYYRLNVVNLHLPPLRERGEDIVKYLLAKFAAEYAGKVKGFSPDALAAMRKFPWPGNVRQLENRLKKAVVLAEGALVTAADLDLTPAALTAIVPLAQAREEFSRRYVFEVLEQNGGNRTKTAQDLGVDPRTIFRYLEREGPISVESERPPSSRP